MLIVVVCVAVIGILIMFFSGYGLDVKWDDISGRATVQSDENLDLVSEDLPLSYVSMPYSNPDPGIYREPIEVMLYTRTEGAVIRYTLDGSEPDEDSVIYGAPINVPYDIDIRARAYKEGMEPSTVLLARFFIRT